jgi:hypothetical protein
VRSPNGRVQIKFALNASQAPTYSVLYDKRTIIADSSLGIEFKQGEYKITQYADGADAAAQPTHVDVTTKEVSAHDKLTVKLAPSGGYAARIESLNE